ncbi:MAG: hypothetical protein HP497_06995 [Nitrospira sp.]|nr:hypothetical protein [Nitrospira sp.]
MAIRKWRSLAIRWLLPDFVWSLSPGLAISGHHRPSMPRTPSPIHADVQEQAAAHACLLDSLGITTAAVFGVSAGALFSIEIEEYNKEGHGRQDGLSGRSGA